jgi:hypothetical protein
MDPILFILIIIVLIITGIILSILISNYNNNTVKNYYSNLPFKSIIQDNAKNMSACPNGCVRGVCSHKQRCTNPHQQNCCVYDFQCNYCKDPITQNYYLNSNANPRLAIAYNKNVNNRQTEILNKKIKKQNEYIQKLNKEIVNVNRQNGY